MAKQRLPGQLVEIYNYLLTVKIYSYLLENTEKPELRLL
jgi:hypothetical protein